MEKIDRSWHITPPFEKFFYIMILFQTHANNIFDIFLKQKYNNKQFEEEWNMEFENYFPVWNQLTADQKNRI